MSLIEKDPEKMWKHNRNNWNNVDIEGHEGVEEDNKSYSFLQHLKFQFIISIIIFVAFMITAQTKHPMIQSAKSWLHTALQQSIDFVAIADWYESTFEGSPSFIPRFGNKSELAISGELNEEASTAVFPIKNGTVLHTFAELLNGIEIIGQSEADVYAVEKGRVMLIPTKQDSVIIQHANDKISIYTRLAEVDVEVSDWVEPGTKLGKLAPIENENYSVLFFAMKQNNQYVDPMEVINVE